MAEYVTRYRLTILKESVTYVVDPTTGLDLTDPQFDELDHDWVGEWETEEEFDRYLTRMFKVISDAEDDGSLHAKEEE